MASIIRSTVASSPAGSQQRGDFVGAVVRLAFHDAAEYDGTVSTDMMRSDGCVNLADPENNGFTTIIAQLEALWRPHCAIISRADYWYLAAKTAIEAVTPNAPDGFAIPLNYGRIDVESCNYRDYSELDLSRLPGAEHGVAEIKRVFVTQLGLTMRDATALLGAHTLGRAQRSNSGYNGPWVRDTSVFDNDFFKVLLDIPWVRQTTAQQLTEWRAGPTLMLNTDMALAYDVDGSVTRNRCGPLRSNQDDCNPQPADSTAQFAQHFAANNTEFIYSYGEAFIRMASAGYDNLQCTGCGACTSARFGEDGDQTTTSSSATTASTNGDGTTTSSSATTTSAVGAGTKASTAASDSSSSTTSTTTTTASLTTTTLTTTATTTTSVPLVKKVKGRFLLKGVTSNQISAGILTRVLAKLLKVHEAWISIISISGQDSRRREGSDSMVDYEISTPSTTDSAELATAVDSGLSDGSFSQLLQEDQPSFGALSTEVVTEASVSDTTGSSTNSSDHALIAGLAAGVALLAIVAILAVVHSRQARNRCTVEQENSHKEAGLTGNPLYEKATPS